MTDRTIGIIVAEIDAIKANNPNWLADIGDKALITALTNEKNLLFQQQAPVQGNDPHLVNSIKPSCESPSHILHICILFAFDEFNLMI